MIRKDQPDLVHLTQKDKFQAIVEDIRDCATRDQPVLVGTTSIETSELLSGILRTENIPHEVLNAKQHDREAQVVAQAGRPGAVTIATNMAGRGTDIVLGGNIEAELQALPPETAEEVRAQARAAWQERHARVLAAGGLHIIGTERHESRRIDNQLRGRSGRQGDPGSSRFYLSMEDNLMRIFGDPAFTKRLLTVAGMKEGEVIESRMLSGRIEKAQRKVESHNFDIRKQLLLFDDVANDQRKVIYQQRTEIMGAAQLSAAISGMREDALGTLLDSALPRNVAHDEWDLDALRDAVRKDFVTEIEPRAWLVAEPELDEQSLRRRVIDEVAATYDAKAGRYGPELMQHVEKDIMLRTLDQHWRDHLAGMDYLRQGIHLRGYAQKDYRYEYKREAYELFSNMLDRVKFDTASVLARIEIRTESDLQREEEERQQRMLQALQLQHAEAPSILTSGVEGSSPDPRAAALGAAAGAAAGAQITPESAGRMLGSADPGDSGQAGTFIRGDRKVGRNEPCPCGSGKKFKQCHGQLQQD
jgi:preprotein translocase subunit SecA